MNKVNTDGILDDDRPYKHPGYSQKKQQYNSPPQYTNTVYKAYDKNDKILKINDDRVIKNIKDLDADVIPSSGKPYSKELKGTIEALSL